MLNFEQEVELGKRLNCWSVDISELKAIDLTEKGFSGAFIFEQSRGGKAIIVGSDGRVLGVPSCFNIDNVLNDIKNNNLWDKSQLPIREITCPVCNNITEFNLNDIPEGVKFDYRCEKCGCFHMIKL